MLPRTIRRTDIYPNPDPRIFGDTTGESTTIAASSPSLLHQSSPVMFLVGIIVLLVVIRIVYEMAPVRGKGV